MPKLVLPFFLALFLALPAVAEAGEASLWLADFDQALEVAKEAKKDLLVDFTGSDWCGWCIKLHKEVFDQEAFLKPVQKDYVLVALDFPRSDEAKAKVPNPERNEELKTQHEVSGFPTVLLVTAEGVVYGRTGYQAGGPEKYVEHLRALAQEGKGALKDVLAFQADFEGAATPEAKAAVVERACARLAEMDAKTPGVQLLAQIVREGVALDPENKDGLKAKALMAILQSGTADEALRDAATAMDPKNEGGLLERVVLAKCQQVKSRDALDSASADIDALDALGPLKDSEVAKELYSAAAFWNFRFLKKIAIAKKYANKLKPLVGDDPRANQLIDSILSQ